METRVNRAANAIVGHHSTPRQRARPSGKDLACRGWSVPRSAPPQGRSDPWIHGNRSLATPGRHRPDLKRTRHRRPGNGATWSLRPTKRALTFDWRPRLRHASIEVALRQRPTRTLFAR